jgi:vanillate monooxygenase ferredoxin subunit
MMEGVLSGTPDHRDVFLTDEEKAAGDKMTCCVSRAKSDELTLDL